MNIKKSRKDNKRTKGFTLIELLVVVVIIGILAAIATPIYLNQRRAAWRATAISDAANGVLTIETVSAQSDFEDWGISAGSFDNSSSDLVFTTAGSSTKLPSSPSNQSTAWREVGPDGDPCFVVQVVNKNLPNWAAFSTSSGESSQGLPAITTQDRSNAANPDGLPHPDTGARGPASCPSPSNPFAFGATLTDSSGAASRVSAMFTNQRLGETPLLGLSQDLGSGPLTLSGISGWAETNPLPNQSLEPQDVETVNGVKPADGAVVPFSGTFDLGLANGWHVVYSKASGQWSGVWHAPAA